MRGNNRGDCVCVRSTKFEGLCYGALDNPWLCVPAWDAAGASHSHMALALGLDARGSWKDPAETASGVVEGSEKTHTGRREKETVGVAWQEA